MISFVVHILPYRHDALRWSNLPQDNPVTNLQDSTAPWRGWKGQEGVFNASQNEQIRDNSQYCSCGTCSSSSSAGTSRRHTTAPQEIGQGMKVPGIKLIMQCPGKGNAHEIGNEECVNNVMRVEWLPQKQTWTTARRLLSRGLQPLHRTQGQTSKMQGEQ